MLNFLIQKFTTKIDSWWPKRWSSFTSTCTKSIAIVVCSILLRPSKINLLIKFFHECDKIHKFLNTQTCSDKLTACAFQIFGEDSNILKFKTMLETLWFRPTGEHCRFPRSILLLYGEKFPLRMFILLDNRIRDQVDRAVCSVLFITFASSKQPFLFKIHIHIFFWISNLLQGFSPGSI